MYDKFKTLSPLVNLFASIVGALCGVATLVTLLYNLLGYFIGIKTDVAELKAAQGDTSRSIDTMMREISEIRYLVEPKKVTKP